MRLELINVFGRIKAVLGAQSEKLLEQRSPATSWLCWAPKLDIARNFGEVCEALGKICWPLPSVRLAEVSGFFGYFSTIL